MMLITMHPVTHMEYWLGGADVDRLGRTLSDAFVTVNSHQIVAALFVLRSPLSRYALHLYHVGLSKIIEAGLVLYQDCAEHSRNILVINSATLRKQWALDLFKKINLPSIAKYTKRYRKQQNLGVQSPFRYRQIINYFMRFPSAVRKNSKRSPGTEF